MFKYFAAVWSLAIVGCADSVPETSSWSEDMPVRFECVDVRKDWEIPETTVRLSQQHCIDSMGPGKSGFYEYFYEYHTYRFSDGSAAVTARAYVHDKTEAHFLRAELDGESRFLAPADFQSRLLAVAVSYFHETGKLDLSWLDPSNQQSGYSPVPTTVETAADGA